MEGEDSSAAHLATPASPPWIETEWISRGKLYSGIGVLPEFDQHS
jgi:hypothetical protein